MAEAPLLLGEEHQIRAGEPIVQSIVEIPLHQRISRCMFEANFSYQFVIHPFPNPPICERAKLSFPRSANKVHL